MPYSSIGIEARQDTVLDETVSQGARHGLMRNDLLTVPVPTTAEQRQPWS
ncbi:hypothetical protein [Rhizobium sp. Root1203]|nr:hypothetical protein [Rhizobium sp. Root1203]